MRRLDGAPALHVVRSVEYGHPRNRVPADARVATGARGGQAFAKRGHAPILIVFRPHEWAASPFTLSLTWSQNERHRDGH
jgi:hypothetical protein